MATIPNELNIEIKTSIPGFQAIKYKPYMSIPTISKSDRFIIFNPLIKLNAKVIDKVPTDMKVKEFFNEGLFESLINYHGKQKKVTLDEATFNGYVDNNIGLTLKTIFPNGGIFYIKGEPYVIADLQWKKGDWKIDTKIQPIKVNKNKNYSYAYSYPVVQSEIISGKSQLNALSPKVLYGDHYTGPKTDNGLAKGPPVKSTTPSTIETKTTTPSASTIKTESTTTPSKTESTTPSTIKTESTTPPNIITNYSPDLIRSDSSTNFFQKYFENPNYKYMIDTINKNMTPEEQTDIKSLYSSKQPMIGGTNDNLNNLTVIQNRGGGDCFFIAVSDAINQYNYTNPDKIISGIYGKGTKIFTQSYLRSIVSNYIINSPDLDDYLSSAELNVEDLNNSFSSNIKSIERERDSNSNNKDLTTEEYMYIVNETFNSHDNFLVKTPSAIPIHVDDYYIPFKLLEKPEIQKYIESNSYWANVIAIHAICHELQLNIITIEGNNKNNLSIPYGNFLKSENNNKWDKFLFLYYYGNHYELITFNFGKKVSIFKRDDHVIVPSYYILFLIYSTYYITMDDQSKEEFTFLPEIFKITNNSFIRIYKNIDDPINKDFMKYFTALFPSSLNKIRVDLKGGQTTNYINNYNYYNTPTSYTNPYPPIQTDADEDELSYFITIYLELQKGTSATDKEMKSAKCRGKWNTVRRSYALVTGQPYIIPPNYDKSNKPSTKGGKFSKKNLKCVNKKRNKTIKN